MSRFPNIIENNLQGLDHFATHCLPRDSIRHIVPRMELTGWPHRVRSRLSFLANPSITIILWLDLVPERRGKRMTMSLNDVLSVLRTKTDPYVVGISLTIHSQAEPPFLPAFYLHMR